VKNQIHNERRPIVCGLQDSEFVRYPTAKRVALVGPPPSGGGRPRGKAPVCGHGAFFWLFFCYDVPLFLHSPPCERSMKKIVLIVVPVLLIAGIVFFVYANRKPEISYKTAKIERGTIASTVSATGNLSAVTTVQVGTQVSGTIQKLYVDYNSRVKKGQPIAEIDPSLFNASVEQSRGNYLNAEANLQRAKVTLADAERTVNRNRKLLADGIISQGDYDVAETAYQSAKAGLKAAEGSVAQTRGSLMQSSTNLRYSIISSPVDGVVISRAVDVGQTVAASFQTPTLFTIAQDLTKMQIEVSVDEADISRIKLDQNASF